MGGVAGPLLEVVVTDPRDVPGAVEGGADRLHVVAPGDPVALSPEPSVVSSMGREAGVPMFVLLRLNDSWTTTGGELERLVGLAGTTSRAARRASRSASWTPTSRSTSTPAPPWPTGCPRCRGPSPERSTPASTRAGRGVGC
jgi:hypothetical protein